MLLNSLSFCLSVEFFISSFKSEGKPCQVECSWLCLLITPLISGLQFHWKVGLQSCGHSFICVISCSSFALSSILLSLIFATLIRMYLIVDLFGFNLVWDSVLLGPSCLFSPRSLGSFSLLLLLQVSLLSLSLFTFWPSWISIMWKVICLRFSQRSQTDSFFFFFLFSFSDFHYCLSDCWFTFSSPILLIPVVYYFRCHTFQLYVIIYIF